MIHEWLDHDPNSCFEANNDCCSCGWRCAFNGSGTHVAGRCKVAHERHAERAAQTEALDDFVAHSGHGNDHFLEGEPEETFDERNQEERNGAL